MSCKSVMNKRAWTLLILAIVVLLFIWSMPREGFMPTDRIKAPPYIDNSDYLLIAGYMGEALKTAVRTAKGIATPDRSRNPTLSEMRAMNKALVDGMVSDLIGEFYSKKYQPAADPLTSVDVDSFMTTYLRQIQTTSPRAYTAFNTTQADTKKLLQSYFVDTPHGDANGRLLGAGASSEAESAAEDAAARSAGYSDSTGYADILAEIEQRGSGAPPEPIVITPTCGTGYTLSSDKTKCTGSSETDTQTPTCATGYTYGAGKCSVGTSGGTTGGSGTILSSNSGTNKGNIWGPAFSGFGDNAGPGAASGGARDYPTLMGPEPKASTMVEGAGIVGISQNESLVKSGALPGSAATGSDANSRYFGSSRVPGDKDLFPNAYQQFTPSTGSSKTEPIPFLSDFSAFFK